MFYLRPGSNLDFYTFDMNSGCVLSLSPWSDAKLSQTDNDVYVFVRQSDYPESIANILDHLEDSEYQGWKSVKPKALLDNCYRTMPCLFKNCFNASQYECKWSFESFYSSHCR